MIVLTVRDLTRQFDSEPVFGGISFDIRRGERVGLVGPNGTGKTTLIHCIMGLDHPDSGAIERPGGVRIGLLRQRAEFAPGRTLLDEAKDGLKHFYDMQNRANALAEQMATATGDALAAVESEYEALHQQMLREDAYSVDHRIDEVLGGLKFSPDDYDRDLNTFSGGQQSRVLLAKLLLSKPDLMLLDEPTNHLDIETTEWLEAYLAESDQGLILVSHDRYFLDRVTTRILELHQGRLSDYKGNFSAYWEQRQERKKVLDRAAERHAGEVAKLETFIKKNKYGQKSAQAKDRERKLARMESVETIVDLTDLPMSFGEATRTGDRVFEAKGLSKGFDGEQLFSGVDLRIERGDRLGILGANGAGKTTFLRTLLGEYEADAGSVKTGTGVKVGYYDQHLSGVDPDTTAIDAARPWENLDITPGYVRNVLAKFGVTGDMALQRVGNMSGGETAKVAFAKICLQDVNVLVLDEPTNHLDLWACNSLEAALKKFEGTILFVSHDRYFIDRVADRVLVIEPERHWLHDGNWSDFVAFRQAVNAGAVDDPAGPQAKKEGQPAKKEKAPAARGSSSTASFATTAKRKRKRKFPFRPVEEIEGDIAKREQELEYLEEEIGGEDLYRDPDRLKETMAMYNDLKEEIASLYEHWEEASELN